MILTHPCFSILDLGIKVGCPGPLPLPYHHALSVCPFEDGFQSHPLDKDEADLHRKLRGNTVSNKNDLLVELPWCCLYFGL